MTKATPIRIYNSRAPRGRKCVRTYRHEGLGDGLDGVYIVYEEDDRNHNYRCREIVKTNFKGGKDE